MSDLRLTRRRALAAVGSVCALAACGSRALAVHFGEILDPEEYPSVGLVFVRKNVPGRHGIGTGTLIAPNLVLTCAHVVDGAPTPFHIRFELDGETIQSRCLAFAIHPSWNRGDVDGTIDIAVLKLDRSLAKGELPEITKSERQPGEDAIVVGYGEDQKRVANIRRSGRLKFLLPHAGVEWYGPGDDRGNAIGGGDSGGPVFVKNEQDRLTIAGLSQAVRNYDLPSRVQAAAPSLDAEQISMIAPLVPHADWLNGSIDRLTKLPVDLESARYLAHELGEPEISLTIDQMVAYQESRAGEEFLLKITSTRGLAEPLDRQAERRLLASGLSEAFVSGLRDRAVPVIKPEEVFSAWDGGEAIDSLCERIRRSGGIYDDRPLDALIRLGFPRAAAEQLHRA